MRRICAAWIISAVLGFGGGARALNVDFEGNKAGQPVEFAGFGNGIFAVSATNSSGEAELPVVLNTEGSNDPNLKYKYAGGNLKTSRLRKVLIVPSELGGTTPDPAGGQLTLTFFAPLLSFGFDVIDVDVSDAPQTFVTFGSRGSDVVTIPFSEFKKSNSPFRRTTVQWGNDTANRFAPFSAREFGVDRIDEIVFDFPSEMAFDNITYRVGAIPEPASAAGLMVGMGALGLVRRRRVAR